MPGGTGGVPFADPTTFLPLKVVWIGRQDGHICGIQCEYQGEVVAGWHGSQGIKDAFLLSEGEAIVSVSVWANANVATGIQFSTSTGRVSRKFGDASGKPAVLRRMVKGQGLSALMGFKGRQGTMLDSLDPVWSDTATLDQASLSIGEIQGSGTDGDMFSMIQLGHDPDRLMLKAVKLFAITKTISFMNIFIERQIVGIQCQFASAVAGESIENDGWTQLHGTTNMADSMTFELQKGEVITAVLGRARANTIAQLQFETNFGRSSGQFPPDVDDTSNFLWQSPVPRSTTKPASNNSTTLSTAKASPTPGALFGFEGRADGGRIWSLAPVWVSDGPESYSLTIDSVDDFDRQNSPATEVDTGTYTFTSGDLETEQELHFERKEIEKSTVELSQESRSMIGTKVGFEVSMEVKGGVPGFGEVKGGAKASGEATREDENTRARHDGEEKSIERRTEVVIKAIHIPKSSTVTCTVVGKQYRLSNNKWHGHMTVKYVSGRTRSFPVNGTLSSTSSTDFKATYTVIHQNGTKEDVKADVQEFAPGTTSKGKRLESLEERERKQKEQQADHSMH